jgi:hypothetical protein
MPKTYQKYAEREIIQDSPLELCLPDGKFNPAANGWSRNSIQVSNIRGHWPRKKLWNYWCVVTPDFLFSITLSNIDYMGLAFAYFLDFKTKEFIEKTVMSPFGKGCELQETVTGHIKFTHKDMELSFSDQGDNIFITVNCPDFSGKKLQASLHIHRPAEVESLNVVFPWSENHYHFTSKQNCLPASGSLRIGEKCLTLNPDSDYACLDFGRGIWKYRSFWNWSSFSTHVGPDQIGVNLGAGWTDGSGGTEDSLLINGRLEKISEDVIFDYNPQRFMDPWHLKTSFSDQVDLTFTPFFERVAKTDLWILRSEVHQMIGKFSGTITSQDGRKFVISEVIGWAEEHQARW